MENIYNPEQLESEAVQKKIMLDTAVDVQTILQILVKNGITTKEEVDQMRDYVKKQPKYVKAYEYINKILNTSNLYKEDPQEYLKQILKAKMEGEL